MLGTALALALPAQTGAAAAGGAAVPGSVHVMPSGEIATLHDVIRGPGEAESVWRFRFVVPALAERVPEFEITDGITEEDAAELDRLGLPAVHGPFDAEALGSAELVTIEELEAEGAIESGIVIDLGADEHADLAGAGPVLPADPGALLQDPAHGDLLWLCETVALPALPPPGDAARPELIVISLSDRPVEFGAMDMGAVQFFDGFSPAEDGQSCLWEPW